MLVVDLFIFGIYLKSAQKSLIKEESNLTITKELRIAEMEEATCKQVEAICILLEESSTHAVQSKPKRKPTQCGYCGRDHPLERSAQQERKHALYAIKKDTLQTFAIQRSKIKKANKQRSNKATVAQNKEYLHNNIQ